MIRPARSGASRHCRPGGEGLESRVLLAGFGSGGSVSRSGAITAYVRHEYDVFVGQLRDLELRSHSTPAQFLALRDDARAISSVASLGGATLDAARGRALAASLVMDRAPLDGWLGESGWARVAAVLTVNLDALNVSRALAEKTLADMRAVAGAADVSEGEFASFMKHWNQLKAGEDRLTSSTTHFTDPGLYYTQHLRGFFRGRATQRSADGARLQTDLRSLAVPTDSALVRRDVQILESLGGAVPSASYATIHDAYLAALASGAPTAADLDRLRTSLTAALGPALAVRRESSVNRLVADAPAFVAATGSNPANVRTLADDVRAVVEDGGGSSGLNPFRIEILAAPGHGG